LKLLLQHQLQKHQLLRQPLNQLHLLPKLQLLKLHQLLLKLPRLLLLLSNSNIVQVNLDTKRSPSAAFFVFIDLSTTSSRPRNITFLYNTRPKY
jgi:hypothetical protein